MMSNFYASDAGDMRNAATLQKLYKISEEDIHYIRELGEFMLPQMDHMVHTWYEWLMTQPEYEQFFSDSRALHHAQKMQHIYWEQFIEAQLDDNYVESRRKIGETHARIGLSMTIFFAGMSIFHDLFSKIMAQRNLKLKEQVRTIDAVSKLLHLDTGIVCEVYTIMSNETITAQSRSLMEMSTPVTQIWENILLLPVVGIVDSKRAQDIMNAVLSAINRTQSRIFILDISGVAVVDTAVANHLIKITKATRLMGCESTISGISPAIAQTMIELGIDVGTIKTTANMMDALNDSFRSLNLQIHKVER
ncbi:protoglobin domain-containing protein [Spirulina subsalsa]|uniref:protoglobin domain-containing protein n=1 Tax=Spirulina subsalsa TaxID=54311 RepID=UPI000303C845|nr:protoglobin domain-containing protein [Spirulina subsalsa]